MEGCLGEESFQMWELNRRLEAYLARVKALEEQNEALSAELGGLRAQSGDASWRARADEELAALRALVEQRWREKHVAEVARDNLAEEVEGVAGRWQRQREARERVEAAAARSRRELDDEQRAQGWLRAQVAELQGEREALRAAHDEERAGLNAQAAARTPCRPAPPRAPPAPAPEVEELARRLGEAWRGAVRGYQERVADLETSLGQARERLGRAVQGAREGRLELQQLRAERGGLLELRAALEQRVDSQWQERLRATEKFQLAVEGLEQEKENLQRQIAQILEGRQQLAHLKMSLSLEVATYRTLLEAENGRLQPPGLGSKAAVCFPGPKLELPFPETPGGRLTGPLPPSLSPSILSSPLPNSLDTPRPAFLKSQEFLQAHTPTLASTPIPPTPQIPCPAAEALLGAQGAPLSLLQPQSQVGEQQAPEAPQAAVSASRLPGPEEPGGEPQEARAGLSPTHSAAPSLSPDAPSAEARDEEPSGVSVFSRVQEEGEGPLWELPEKETVLEAQRASSLQREVWGDEGGLGLRETGDPQEPREEEATGALQQETPGKEDHESLRSPEEEEEEEDEEPLRFSDGPFETPQSLGNDSGEPPESLAERDGGGTSPPEKGTHEHFQETHMFSGNEAPPAPLLLEEDEEGIRSRESDGETRWGPGTEMQEAGRSLEAESREAWRQLEEGSQELLNCPEAENQEADLSADKENQEPPKEALEDAPQETWGPAKEMQEPLSTPSGGDPETWAALEKEKQEPLRAPDEQNQQDEGALESGAGQPSGVLGDGREQAWTAEPPASPGQDSEPLNPLEEVTQESWSQEEGSAETVRASGTETHGLLGSAREELGMAAPPETPEPTWPREDLSQESAEPLEKGAEDSLGFVEEKQRPQRAQDEQSQDSLSSPDEADEEGAGGLAEKVRLEQEEEQESPMCPQEKLLQSAAEDLQRWADGGGREQAASGRAGADSDDEPDLGLRESPAGKESLGQEGVLLATAGGTGPTEEGHPSSPGPEEQAPAQGALGDGGAEGALGASDLAVPQEGPEGVGPVWSNVEAAPWGCPQVTWGAEAAMGTSAVGEGQEQGLGDLGDAGHQAREEVGEEVSEEARLQVAEEAREGVGATLESGFSPPLGRAWDPADTPTSWEEPIPGHQERGDTPQPGLPGDQEQSDTPQPGVPGAVMKTAEAEPPKPLSPTEVPQDSLKPQPWAEGGQEAYGGLEDKVGALGVDGEQELGSGGLLEEEEEEESRDESEADELSETLPDSTPLGLYQGSPASPVWAPAGEQRPSPPGDTLEEQPPTALAHEGLQSQPWAEEQEEEGGRESELSEEFEDLATEASLLPGAPRGLTDPQEQGFPREPAAWEGESDGFADEEENGEDGEEDKSGDKDLGIPGDAGWGNTETSSSKEDSDSVPSGKDPLLLLGVGQVGLDAGMPLGVNGQGPSLQEELEHVNGGVMNGLEPAEEGGQGKLGTTMGDQQGPLEEVAGTLKTPWAGATLNLGPGQFLQFTQGEGEGDSWSSGED
ncbi:nestin [Sorex fumeus]|uniref:nestin n=1 Tax=Sorex fumeus TaxID=62283 RepID=UPI0024ACEEF6|nr:nestin [Sorex fumeus]